MPNSAFSVAKNTDGLKSFMHTGAREGSEFLCVLRASAVNHLPTKLLTVRTVTSFIIEHQCPQCGAPAELAETDRIFRCGFCRVASCLSMPDHFRYVLPHKAPAGKELIYFPYWRFKGMHVACLPAKVEPRIVDLSHQAVPSLHFPVSVGFRSQTQRLRFATADAGGRFLSVKTPLEDFLAALNQRLTEELPRPILHNAYIGETISLLYAPFYLHNGLCDALLNRPVAQGDTPAIEPLLNLTEQPNWPIRFMAALCPHCGQDLEGERDALVLTCANCSRAWGAQEDRLAPIACGHLAQKDGDPLFMPFWRIQADVNPLTLRSYADLVRTANLPKVVQPAWEGQPFYFYTPGFKLRPQILLAAAAKLTLNQPAGDIAAGPPAGRRHPVNMPLPEAVQTIKPLLAGFMRPRERMVQTLTGIQVRMLNAMLVYLPFRESHHDLVHDGVTLAFSKNVLGHSRNL
jgi:hypothetical protein